MNPVLTHIVGPGTRIEEPSSYDPELYTLIGNGEKNVFLQDLTARSPANILDMHGGLKAEPFKNITHSIQLFNGMPSTIETLHLLSLTGHRRHFYILTCYAGSILSSLKESKYSFPPNCTFTLFGAKNHPLSTFLAKASIKNIISLYGQCKGCPPKKLLKKIAKIDQKVFEQELYSPWDVIRCEITPSKKGNKLTACKVGSPKNHPDILSHAKDFSWKPRLKFIYAEDKKVKRKWKKIAKNARPSISIQKYRYIGLMEAITHHHILKVRSWIMAGAEINPQNSVPPLVQACLPGLLKITQELLLANAEVNIQIFKHSLLYYTFKNKLQKTSQLLLENGASPDDLTPKVLDRFLNSPDSPAKTAIIEHLRQKLPPDKFPLAITSPC